MRMSEHYKFPYVIKSLDNQAGATGDSINSGTARHITWLLQLGALTGDAVLTVKSGASQGTETTSETFHYRLADAEQAAAGADAFGDWANSSSLTLTAATYDNKILIIELDPREVTADQPWLTLSLSGAADVLNSSCVAVVEPRYSGHDAPTVI
ncbi:MAG: hypothetical protein Q8Q14_04650 [Gemmatimonadales bacterium]|nr:hypothetical protein [Gemmatimonadales bacterium]